MCIIKQESDIDKSGTNDYIDTQNEILGKTSVSENKIVF